MSPNETSADENMTTDTFSPLRWEGDRVVILDQTLLPKTEEWLDCFEPEQVAEAIRRLSIRGAPAIGVAAAYGLVVGLGARDSLPQHADELRRRFAETFDLLAATRPTAVNLQWALDRGRDLFDRRMASGDSPQEVRMDSGAHAAPRLSGARSARPVVTLA